MLKRLKFLLVIICVSCIKEESTYSETFIMNKSSFEVRIVPYYLGSEVSQESINLPKGENTKVFAESNEGKGTGISYPRNLAIMDSVIVFFGDTIQITHYRETTIGSNIKAIRYNSPRSLYNESNYARKIKSERKHSIVNEYNYVITDQDAIL